MTKANPQFKEIATKKVQLRDAKFKPEWLVPQDQLPGQDVVDVTGWIGKSGHLSEQELEITESNVATIVENIREKVWSAVDVTSAFCHRASIAQQLTNCLSEVFFEEALIQAKELDEYQAKNGDVKGPFHGLPISLKDNLNVKGQATTIGIVNFCFNPETFETDSVLVGLLRDMGAVFYVKTNVPVAMMMPETDNHIYGNTTNPMNRLLSAGGSSGGEAALLRSKGSPIGIGSDIGGSIRIPASFQNLYSLRPSFGRFPTFGARGGLPGFESVNSVNGPMSTNLDSMEIYCKTVIGSEPWNHDPKVVDLPWRSIELPDKLNIAVCVDDGIVCPTPPIRRGMQMVTDLLKEDGHDVIEWDTTDHKRLSEIITEFFVSDGGHHIKKELEATGETLFSYMNMFDSFDVMEVPDLWKLQNERTLLAKRYLDRWLATKMKTKNGKPIDAIIMPATPFAGNPNGKYHGYVGFTSIFNVLDYAVGTFPVTRADKDLDLADPESANHSIDDTKIWQDYNPEETHGGAVALQLIGRRFQEEKVVEMLKVVSKIVAYSD